MEPLNILIVDDETGMRTAVARALANFKVALPDVPGDVKFVLQQAGSGEEAIELLAGNKQDIVLLDHKLPGISGLDVLAHIAEKNLDCLVVMITAYASLETAITATKRGAYDFLAKPFTPDELKAAVRKAAKHLILARRARQLEAEKRQVRFQTVSVVAHELKAPLGAIEGYLYLLRDRPAGNEWSAYEKAIGRSIIRLQGMRKLITDLLDLARIESGQKKRELKEIDLREVAQSAIDLVKAEADERRIAVTLTAPEKLTMVADRGEMDIVFNNLVTNAVKYNRPDGKVEVKLAEADGRVTVEVCDTGYGMTEADCAKLFNDFVRIKNKNTKDVPGTGLGLSTLKKTVNQYYGGDVSVRSEPNVGSTFTVVMNHGELPPAP